MQKNLVNKHEKVGLCQTPRPLWDFGFFSKGVPYFQQSQGYTFEYTLLTGTRLQKRFPIGEKED